MPRASTRTPLVGSQKVAAEELGVTATALRQWMAQPGFPDCSAGFDLAAIRAWRQERGKKGSEAGETVDRLKTALLAQRVRREKVRADREERHALVDAGELLPRQKWELFAALLLTNLGDAFDQLPDLIAAICCPDCGRKVHARLAEELDARRNEIAEELRRGGPQDQTT